MNIHYPVATAGVGTDPTGLSYQPAQHLQHAGVRQSGGELQCARDLRAELGDHNVSGRIRLEPAVQFALKYLF